MGALLRSEEVAKLLHIGAQTARRMMREGRLPAIKIGSRWYVRADDFERLFERGGERREA